MFEKLLLNLLRNFSVDCKEAKISSFYFCEDNIPQKKTDNAFEYYKIPSHVKIYALIDITAWGSAKDGIAFTTDGIYWKNYTTVPLFSTLNSLSYIAIKHFKVLHKAQNKIIIGSHSSPLFDVSDILEYLSKNLQQQENLLATKLIDINGSSMSENFVASLFQDIIELCQKKEHIESLESSIAFNLENNDNELALKEINEMLTYSPSMYYKNMEVEALVKLGNYALAEKKLNSLLNLYLNYTEYTINLKEELIKLEEITVNSDAYRQRVASLKNAISTLSIEDTLKNMNTDEKSTYSELKVLEAKCFAGLHKYINAYWSLISAAEYAQDYELRNEIVEDINKIYCHHIISDFSTMDYLKRKVVFFDDNYNTFKPNHIFPLNIHNKGNLKFPPSHPIKGQLYVGHPFIENLYFPIEDYENDLFKSEVMELSYLLKSLGAVKIKTEYIKGSTNSRELNEVQSNHEHKNTGGSIGGGNKLGSGELSTNIDKTTSTHSESSIQSESQVGKRMTIDGTFIPTKKPFIPEDLIWFEHNEIWKSLAKQRLDGGLESYDLILSTKSVEQVNDRELKTIDEEYKMLLSASGKSLAAKGHSDTKIENDSNKSYESLLKLKKKETIDMRVFVEFAPIETLTEEAPTLATEAKNQTLELSNKSVQYTEAETEYIEYLKDSIEDGKIEDASRRVLERRRVKLGLSEERVAAIENEILNKNNFTEIELDFIQEIEFCLEDDGIIDESEMKMLNRMRDKVGINQERSAELIEFVKSKREPL